MTLMDGMDGHDWGVLLCRLGTAVPSIHAYYLFAFGCRDLCRRPIERQDPCSGSLTREVALPCTSYG